MNKINNYELYTKKPNTIHPKARVYFKTFHFDTLNNFKNRLVRVYIPSNYDFNDSNKRFKVIYMLDGKNLFDDYTSFVGEWGVDETIEEMISKKSNDGYIVVGIDAPNNDYARSKEMTPSGIEFLRRLYSKGPEYAEVLGEFIFKIVKPDIDKTFYTRPDYTGVAGSSMGGLMAFYLALAYPEEIKFSMPFSPAFFFFKWNSFETYLRKNVGKNLPKIFFYVGGQGFESIFVKSTIKTYNYLLKQGFGHDQIKLIYDSEQEHNEKAWRYYFPIMLERID